MTTTPGILSSVHEEDDGVYTVGLYESDYSGSWALLLMECDEESLADPQEVALGMDTYCLVVDPGQFTHYGGVRECTMTGTHLNLKLTTKAAAELQVPEVLTFALNLSAQEMETMRFGLARVLSSGRPSALPKLLGFEDQA